MKKLAFFLLCSFTPFLTPFVSPAAASPSDFDVSYALDASEEGRLYRVPLTKEIYQNVRRSYRDDIAVFDASEAPVPFFIRSAGETRKSVSTLSKSADIPVFSLPRKGDGPSSLLDVSVRVTDGGKVVEVREKEGTRGSASDGNRRYLLDLSGVLGGIRDPGKISSGALSLALGGTADIMANVSIYGSQNLKNWELLNEREPLVRLNQGEQRIESRRIRMGSPRRYLLLHLEDEGDAPLEGVSVEFSETAAFKPAMEEVSFEGAAYGNPRMVLYDTNGVFPAERVNLILTSPGIYPLSLYARRSLDDSWEMVGRMKLSFIKGSSGERRNVPVDLTSPLERRYWVVSFDATAPSRVPQLEFSWQQKEVVFLAQGPPPYKIAVGRRARGAGMQTPRLFDEALKDFPEGDILESKAGEILSGDRNAGRAETSVTQGKAWQQYFVWGMLVVGAMLLSWMAWNLLQKNRGRS